MSSTVMGQKVTSRGRGTTTAKGQKRRSRAPTTVPSLQMIDRTRPNERPTVYGLMFLFEDIRLSDARHPSPPTRRRLIYTPIQLSQRLLAGLNEMGHRLAAAPGGLDQFIRHEFSGFGRVDL